MPHIVFAWELGGGYGHIGGFLPIALRLRDQGHHITCVLRDLTHAHTLLASHDIPCIQAPVWLNHLDALTHPVNYAEILFKVGFLSQSGLAGMVTGWRSLLDILQPNLILFDHAPTALLASRGLSASRALLGNGFFCPPRVSPMPSIRTGSRITHAHLIETERRALDVGNAVLRAHHMPELVQLSDLFDVDENFLMTFRELDHYPDRDDAVYWGPRMSLEEGVSFEWPSGEEKKVFAYIKPNDGQFEIIMQALASLPVRAVVHAPSLSRQLIARYESPRIRIYTQPIKMSQASRECDLAICHSGMGTVSAVLLAGRPLLMLPMHQEQFMLARRVVQFGAGLIVENNSSVSACCDKILTLLNDSCYTAGAKAFSTQYENFSQPTQIRGIVARCDALARIYCKPR